MALNSILLSFIEEMAPGLCASAPFWEHLGIKGMELTLYQTES